MQALGVNQILVAINKLDAAIPPWSIDRYNAVKDAVEPFLKQIGFKQNKVSRYSTLNITCILVFHGMPSVRSAAQTTHGNTYNITLLCLCNEERHA
jgi:hypothetical protein